jgi:cytochrome c553
MRTLCGAVAIIASAGAAAAGFTSEFREALHLKANREHGRLLYAACAACHQPNGAGRAKAGVPNIAGQHHQFLIKQLVDYREVERADERMEVAAKHALKGPQEIADVAAYIAGLPPIETDDRGPGQFLAQGQAIYARACSHCHGAAAEGNGQLRFPRLAGQHYSYTTWQIKFMVAGDRVNVTWDHILLLETLTPDEISGVAGYLARLK